MLSFIISLWLLLLYDFFFFSPLLLLEHLRVSSPFSHILRANPNETFWWMHLRTSQSDNSNYSWEYENDSETLYGKWAREWTWVKDEELFDFLKGKLHENTHTQRQRQLFQGRENNIFILFPDCWRLPNSSLEGSSCCVVGKARAQCRNKNASCFMFSLFSLAIFSTKLYCAVFFATKIVSFLFPTLNVFTYFKLDPVFQCLFIFSRFLLPLLHNCKFYFCFIKKVSKMWNEILKFKFAFFFLLDVFGIVRNLNLFSLSVCLLIKYSQVTNNFLCLLFVQFYLQSKIQKLEKVFVFQRTMIFAV